METTAAPAPAADVHTLRAPAHRAPVVGVRQLGHAVQGLSAGGRAARPVREGRGRGAGPPVHGRRADGRAAHPVGQGRRLRPPRRPRAGAGRRPRDDQLEHVPGQRLHAGRRSATPTPASAARPSTTCSSASTSWTRPGRGTSSCGSPTAPTTRARTTSAAARTAWPRACGSSTTASATDQRLVLEYKFFEPAFYHTDVPDWGTALRPLPRAGAEGAGRARHRPPRARHEHRVHRRPAAPRRAARGVRLQQPVLRGRRPDGRLGGPVPAVPDPPRVREGRRPSSRTRACSSCSTSATTWSPRSRARSGP